MAKNLLTKSQNLAKGQKTRPAPPRDPTTRWILHRSLGFRGRKEPAHDKAKGQKTRLAHGVRRRSTQKSARYR